MSNVETKPQSEAVVATDRERRTHRHDRVLDLLDSPTVRDHTVTRNAAGRLTGTIEVSPGARVSIARILRQYHLTLDVETVVERPSGAWAKAHLRDDR